MANGNMELQFVLLFGITVVAFICAINSRGAVKMSFSYVLATALLVLSVYEGVTYVSEQKFSFQMRQVQAVEEARRNSEQARRSSEEAARAAAQEAESRQAISEYSEFIKAVADRGKEIPRGLRNLNLQDESVEIETFFAKAGTASSRASALARELQTRKSPEGTYEDSRKTLQKAFQRTETAAKYLSLYFKSEDEYEEEERGRIFHSNVDEAISLFDQASLLIAQKK